jgi:type I restriction enzyme S subunit
MWTESRLDQLALISSGGTPSRDIGEFWGGSIPWVTPTDITACETNYVFETAERISKKGLLSSAAKLLPAGTILLTSRATVGVSRIAGNALTTNQGFKNLIPQAHVDGRFLFYQVQRQRGAFERYAAGSTFPEINKKDTARVLIAHPLNKSAQQQIALILSCIDTAIEKTEALIAKHQQIKAGLMHDLFTRGVLPNGQLRPPRSEAPELYQETTIGWIPLDWQLSTLRQCLIDSPTNGIYKPAHQIGEGMLMVGQTAFTEQRSIDFTLCRRGAVDKVEAHHYGLSKNDILVTRVFATVEGVGLPTLVPELVEPAVFESNMMRLRIDTSLVMPQLLFELLQAPTARRQITGGANASNQCSVNQGVLNPLHVALPPPDEQKRITARIERADRQREAIIKSLSKLKMQKLGLMQDLLTGRVPVPTHDQEPGHA